MRTVSERSCWERCFINTMPLVSKMTEKWLSEHPMKPRHTCGKWKELVQAVCNLLWLVPWWTRVHCGVGGWGRFRGHGTQKLVLLEDKDGDGEAGLQVKDGRLQLEAGAGRGTFEGSALGVEEGGWTSPRALITSYFVHSFLVKTQYILSINKKY